MLSTLLPNSIDTVVVFGDKLNRNTVPAAAIDGIGRCGDGDGRCGDDVCFCGDDVCFCGDGDGRCGAKRHQLTRFVIGGDACVRFDTCLVGGFGDG